MNLAELFAALKEEIHRQIQSGEINGALIFSRNWWAIIDPAGRRTVAVAFRGDEQALVVTVRGEGMPREVARWTPSLEDPGSVVILSSAVAMLRQWFHEA